MSATATPPPTLSLTPPVLSPFGIAEVRSSPATPPPGAPPPFTNGLSYSPSGSYLVSSHSDGTLRLASGDPSAPLFGFQGGFNVKYGCRGVTHTHANSCVLHASTTTSPSDGQMGAVAYHSLHDNKIIRFFRGHTQPVASISMHPTKDEFLTASRDGTFKLWDLRSPNATHSGMIDVSGEPVAAYDPFGVVFGVASPSRTLALYTGDKPSEPYFKSTTTGLLNVTCGEGGAKSGSTTAPRFPRAVPWSCVEFSPDDGHGGGGKFIALGTGDRGVLVVDAWEPAREVALLAAHPIDPGAPPTSVSWSSDGRWLCVGGADGVVYGYDMAHPPMPLKSDDAHFEDAAFPTVAPLEGVETRWAPPCIPLGEGLLSPDLASKRRSEVTAAAERVDAWVRRCGDDAARRGRDVPLPPLPLGVGVPPPSRGEDAATRQEAPVRMVRWAPDRGVLASGAGGVLLWGPTTL